MHSNNWLAKYYGWKANAVLTAGYRLKAPNIIHAVAPQWFGGHNCEAELLEKCYRSIFGIVEMEGFKSVAIPAMGIGTYRWPVELATPIGVHVVKEFNAQYPAVLLRFVCFSEAVSDVYRAVIQQEHVKK
jgi:O-acetyl-ADP-ribose deacetylase (regulator of RNase III)